QQKAERESLRAEVGSFMTQEPNSSILRSLRQGMPEDTVVIAGMTQIGYFSRPFFPVYRPSTYITSSYSGNLGFEYPTALGAKVANPGRPVVMIAGDGGFLYYAQEMSTAVQQGINVVAVVFNDNAYGNVARDLDEHWGGKFGAELHNPDFVRLAEAYGAVGRRAEEPGAGGGRRRAASSSPTRSRWTGQSSSKCRWGGWHGRCSSRRSRRCRDTSTERAYMNR